MIDVGLLVSIAAMLVVPAVFLRPATPDASPSDMVELGAGPLLVGVLGGRIAAMLLDDPSSLGNIRDILIIRSGVEFWPGVAIGCACLAWNTRRQQAEVAKRLADMSVVALAAWATFEATCLLRDGCPGPPSRIGLRPDGLTTRVLPIGLIVAVAAGGAAWGIARLRRHGLDPRRCIVATVAAIAAIRSVSSIWLPHIGSGLTRQHRESIAVAALSCALLAGPWWRSRQPTAAQVQP